MGSWLKVFFSFSTVISHFTLFLLELFFIREIFWNSYLFPLVFEMFFFLDALVCLFLVFSIFISMCLSVLFESILFGTLWIQWICAKAFLQRLEEFWMIISFTNHSFSHSTVTIIWTLSVLLLSIIIYSLHNFTFLLPLHYCCWLAFCLHVHSVSHSEFCDCVLLFGALASSIPSTCILS